MKRFSLVYWTRRFITWAPVKNTLRWSKQRSFPGFFGVPIYDVLVFMYQELKSSALSIRANGIAFSFFISLFPALIVLLTLLPFLTQLFLHYITDGERFFEVLYQEIKFVMPGDAGDIVFNVVEDLTTRPRNGLLSLGFVLALFFASNGMMAMMTGFDKSYWKTFKKRKPLRRRLIALGLTFILGSLLTLSVVMIILGKIIIKWLSEYIRLDWFGTVSLSLLRYIVIFSLFYFGFSFIYRFGASVRKRFSYFSPGTTMATILSLLSSVAFSLYVDYFNTYNKLYGSIGTIIVLMLWIQLNVMILLAGFELNASIAVNRDLKAEREEDH